VTFESAATVNLTGGMKTYYAGPNRVAGSASSGINEVVKASENEGRLVWAIGRKTKQSFTVATTSNTVTITFAG
jgi:hypothetical protein